MKANETNEAKTVPFGEQIRHWQVLSEGGTPLWTLGPCTWDEAVRIVERERREYRRVLYLTAK